mmetsp:Transcript_5466/g.9249  ORF Transcript_5466/g.9249 Transcript_5466/m.9249 type:complete len:501 (-) Transcript_5466:381-1883(-)
MQSQQKYLIYVNNLPKRFDREHQQYVPATSAAEVATAIYDTTGVLLKKCPIINYQKDMYKPFLKAFISLEDAEFHHNKSLPVEQRAKNEQDFKDKFRFPTISNHEVRVLPHDETLKGDKREDTNKKQNIFLRGIDKGKSHQELFDEIKQKVPNCQIKSLMISRSEQFKSKGYGFVCFEDEEQAKQALKVFPKDNAIPWNPQNLRNVEKKLKNNIYVKEFPETWDEKKLKEEFGKFGNILSIFSHKHTKGEFAFICYEPTNGKSGAECAAEAVKQMNGTKVEEKELYVTFAEGKFERTIEKQKNVINLKQSKRRCNLLVKGFPQEYTEDEIRKIFGAHGTIENVKMISTRQSPEVCHSAFVCFQQPSEASEATLSLNGKSFGGKTLEVKPYEIKELKQNQILQAKDRSNFEDFYNSKKAGGTAYQAEFDITNTPGMAQILQQVLQVAHHQMTQNQLHNQMVPRNNYNNNYPRGRPVQRGGGQQHQGQRTQHQGHQNMRGPE